MTDDIETRARSEALAYFDAWAVATSQGPSGKPGPIMSDVLADFVRSEMQPLLEVLAPFARRAEHVVDDTPDDFACWHPAVGSIITVSDLRRAATVYATFSKEMKL